MKNPITIERDALEILVAAASAGGEDLATGLDDGTYEEDSLGGFTVAEIDDAIEHAGTILNGGGA